MAESEPDNLRSSDSPPTEQVDQALPLRLHHLLIGTGIAAFLLAAT